MKLLNGMNLSWYCDIDYETYYPGCDGCINDIDYCHCGTLENIFINDIDGTELAANILELPSKPKQNALDIKYYAVRRILRATNFCDKDNFNVEPRGGYYGEEIGKVTTNQAKIDEVDKLLIKLGLAANETDMVKLVLELEYGELLPELEEVTFEMELLDPKDILIPNQEHYEKSKNSIPKEYTNNEALGVVLKEKDKYRLIDGYHRTSFWFEKINKDEVLYIVGQ